MHFQLKDVLTAIGPSASIVFAAWIFMSFLQNRYSQAFQLYRELIQECREREMEQPRGANVRAQVLLFRRRFELMRQATNLGLVAAMLLISTLIGGAVNAVFPALPLIPELSTVLAVMGFLLVITASGMVIVENSLIQQAVDAELLDVPDLAESTGQKAGTVGEQSKGALVSARPQLPTLSRLRSR